MTTVRHRELHGHDITFRCEGHGPALLLVHGMAGRGATWDPVIAALAEHNTVIAPDLLGHGSSAKPRGDYSLGAYASVLRDLLVALGHESATVVGQSLGGGIAMQFAYQFPERCDRLVLVSSGGLGSEVNVILRALTLPGAEHILPLACHPRIAGVGEAVTGFLERIGLRLMPATNEVFRSYTSLSDPTTREAFVHTLRAVVDVHGQRVSAADRLYLASDVPTLVVWGDHDPIIPVEHAYAAHEAIAGSRLEIFEGAGHYPHCEDPERFVAVVREFLATTAPAGVSPTAWRARLTAS
jgi:pimeloyl-ACP methyl ester carboxylesterase